MRTTVKYKKRAADYDQYLKQLKEQTHTTTIETREDKYIRIAKVRQDFGAFVKFYFPDYKSLPDEALSFHRGLVENLIGS
ncbi:hypothetical protein ACFS5N_16305 [Mucilaginibacter ximonensis]|uniref:Uncharacterized protein n=1 Tax=Mucilaginibacter ximonensis TaxID=538021 RepID=A0ABW5YFJ8_9SPHI